MKPEHADVGVLPVRSGIDDACLHDDMPPNWGTGYPIGGPAQWYDDSTDYLSADPNEVIAAKLDAGQEMAG